MNTYHCCSHSFWVSTRSIILAGVLILLASCGGGESGQDPDPAVQDFPFAYVERPLPTDNQGNLIQLNASEAQTFNPGAVLYIKPRATVSAPATDISSGVVDPLTSNNGQDRDIKDLEFFYDGSLLVFAMLFEDVDPNDGDLPPTWNIYEYDVVNNIGPYLVIEIGTEDGDDIAPYYLPDGRIVFSSTRQHRSKAILLDEGNINGFAKPQFTAVDEDDNEHGFVLHVATVDRNIGFASNPIDLIGIKQITFNQSHDLDPSVLTSGKLLFSRWDNMGNRNQISLYTANPDGTNLQQLYGVHSHNTGSNGSTVQFTDPRETQDGRVMAILRPFTGTFEGGDIVMIDVKNYIDNTQPTAANAGLGGNGQTSASFGNINTQTGVSTGGRFIAAHPLLDGTNRALVSWSQCLLLDVQDILDPDDDITLACTQQNLANPNLIEAPPRYGVFLMNLDQSTQLPIVLPIAGRMFTDVAVAVDRTTPVVIADTADESPTADQTGTLNIRSVYDMDGTFNDFDNSNTATSLSQMMEPTSVAPGNWPARFLRIVKAASLPDDTVRDIDNSGFGVGNGNQLMREIVANAVIEPDGSVTVTVPANVPLSISVLDKNGRRISNRHQNWIQVRPGETLTCNGCHDHASGGIHGRSDAENASLNAGAAGDGVVFFAGMLSMDPVSMNVFLINAGDTMAETHTRTDPNALLPSLDIIYQDVWTDETVLDQNGNQLLVSAPAINYIFDFADGIQKPVTQNCIDNWSEYCRNVINYESHVHPLWSRDRGASTCTTCHSLVDANGNPQVPAGQLDLTDGASDLDADHFKAYRELVSNDIELINQGGAIVEGTATVLRSVTPGNALNSSAFFNVFEPALSVVPHYDAVAGQAWLTQGELKFLSEWIDIGAQYYNNPFDAPTN